MLEGPTNVPFTQISTMAYTAVHLLALAWVTLGWVLCVTGLFLGAWYTHTTENSIIGNIPLPFKTPVTLSTFIEERGVWYYNYTLSAPLFFINFTRETVVLFYDPLLPREDIRLLWACRFFSLANIFVACWTILAGWIDAVGYRGRSSAYVGLLGLLSGASGVITLILWSQYNPPEITWRCGVYILGVIVLSLSALIMVAVPSARPPPEWKEPY